MKDRGLAAEARGAVSDDLLGAAIDVLGATPSPPGEEAAAADAFAIFLQRELVGSHVTVHRDGASADVEGVIENGEPKSHLGLYSHLDTSLTGDAIVDAPITGLTAPPPPLIRTAETAVGFGLSVARAPTAAAVAAVAAAGRVLSRHGIAHRLSLLATGGGTHRAHPAGGVVPPPDVATPGFGAGAHRSLERGYRPDAILNVKAAAPGVLYEEPGAMFVRMAVHGPMFPALARRKLAPGGGAIGTGRRLMDAFEAWRDEFVERPTSGQCGREAAIGAVRAGSFDKVDLVAAIFEAAAYVMFPPGEDPSVIAAELGVALEQGIDGDVEVEVYASDEGGSSLADATIVMLANEVWDKVHGPGTHVVSDWTGSTDGAIFRRAGIDTARIGISTTPGDDHRTDVVDMAELRTAAEMYAAIACRFMTEG